MESVLQKINLLEKDYKQVKKIYELTLDLIRETLSEEISNETRRKYIDYEIQTLQQLERLEETLKNEREQLSNELINVIRRL